MLPREKRLNLKTSFNFVIKGQKAESSLYNIFFRTGDPSVSSGQVAQAKVGIALKKEYFKLAVDRNRARRLTSRTMEVLYPQLKEKVNLILMPKPGVLKLNSKELTEILEKELRKSDLLA